MKNKYFLMRLRKFIYNLDFTKGLIRSGYPTKTFYILFLLLMYKLTVPSQHPNNFSNIC